MKTKHDPVKFNKVSRKRHLDLNKLMKESFGEVEKPEISKVKKDKKK
jgi:hypothetical protein